ncbi:DUF924 family protein [Xanthobacter sp. DSM 24535]|uniref:DUF924 family protein n=1 Tax=Roseixanthobacter psychrophilus TaxID=3119917 RepID=UPI0037268C0E
MTASIPTPSDIVTFWRAAGYERWFAADPAFDADVRARLLPAHEDAVARGAGATVLPDYETTPEGTLALILLLDQVPRNIFRGTPRAFATDPAALAVANRALGHGFDAHFEPKLRGFFYLPLMHAEDLRVQQRCVALYEKLGAEAELKYALLHRDIIERFGRFPHRNPILGRDMTPQEQAYLAAGGFTG